MAKDEQESGRSTVADQVTDEDLQSALEEALAAGEVEEEEAPAEDQTPEKEPEAEGRKEVAAEEPPPPPPQQEEPTDPRERTALGRKVKGLELEIQRLQQQLQQRQAPPAKTSTPDQDEEVPEFITTPDELERYLAIRDRRKQAEVQGYQVGYGQRFLEMGREDPLYDEIEQEMMANFNRRDTGNPIVDAELNYNRAKASVLTKKMATPAAHAPAPPPKIPGKGDKPQGSGVTIASRNARPASAPPPLDEFASDFIKRTGMSEDSVRSALGASKPRR